MSKMKQHFFVSVPEKSQYMGDQFDTPTGHAAEYSKWGVRGKWQRSSRTEVYSIVDCRLNEIIETFNRVSEEQNCNRDTLVLEAEEVDEYGSTYMRYSLRGSREATAEEVATVEAYQKWRIEYQVRQAEAQREYAIEQARKHGLTADDLA